jgi:hypothetical protein
VLQNGNLTRSHYLPPQPSKGRRATPAWQSRAASCYTTASSAAALGHLGAVHKRVSGAKTARSSPASWQGWKGRYRLEGPVFIYTDQDTGRVATILGYPTDELSQIG